MAELLSEQSSKEPIPIWLDCDPGHDDAFAILLASTTSSLKLLGISIVHGNDTTENCAKNANRMLWAFGVQNVPVYTGISRPIIREPKYCPEIHGIPGEQGVAGMCGYHFPDGRIFFPGSSYCVSEEGSKHGIVKMANVISHYPKKVTIVLTGAQTNLAMALRMFPEMKENIEKVVFMGGAIGLGNTGIAAEFNIQIDPEAASIVFHSGIPLVMIPLEVTHKVLVTPSILEKIANIDNEPLFPLPTSISEEIPMEKLSHRHYEYKEVFQVVERCDRKERKDMNTMTLTSKIDTFSSPLAECCHQLLTFFKGTYCKEFGFLSPPLHDPCTIFYLTNPESFRAVNLYVEVETEGSCAGRTLCDVNNLKKKPNNVLVCVDIDVDKFWLNMLHRIQQASKNSPLNQ